MNVAFLGLGTMGAPMAENLLRHHHSLTVWNRTAARSAELVKKGARLAATPAEAASAAEVVCLMLADPAAVDAVLGGAGGVLAGLRPGTIVIDHSTVDPACARRSDEAVRARGGIYLDAPVSGTRKPAEEGTLLILAAGPEAALERVRPLLEAMGRVRHVGAVGQAMAMKLVLNGLGAHMLTGLCAMLAFGARQGLDGRTMLEVIGGGAFSSPLFVSKGARILARDFHPDFTLALMLKDQELVLGEARAAGHPMPSEQVIAEILKQAIADGLGDDDLCGLIRLFEAQAGATVTAK
ncbi:MAG: NAD(P)-dependent oxidoreductase [Polyangia bacterium]